MKTIKDKDGRDWQIPSLSTGYVTRLREEADFIVGDWKNKTPDEAKAIAGELMLSLYNPFVLAMVLQALTREQAVERGISEADFGFCFDSDQYDAIRLAIAETIADFRLPPLTALTVKKSLPGDMANLDAALNSALRSVVTGSPASSELTPAA